jgi:phosphatidylglycerol---prolipoprotein diacylglyceryl transferase
MPAAFLPSPASAGHLGPLPLRGYAICLVLGILVAVGLANRRYLRGGGRTGVILEVAIWAIVAGLIGARIYGVITDYELYFSRGLDWAEIFRFWDGGTGIPGALAGGAAGAWLACRRLGVGFAPVAGAAAPAVAFGQAIGRWGDWFNQDLYGRPSSLPWAVEIDPAHRIVPYLNYATFQPTFLYESLWDVAVGLGVIWAARRFLLTGDRMLALYAGLYAAGGAAIQALRVDFAHDFLALRVDQWVLIAVVLGAVGYLVFTGSRPAAGFAAPAPRADPESNLQKTDVSSGSGVSRTASGGDD